MARWKSTPSLASAMLIALACLIASPTLASEQGFIRSADEDGQALFFQYEGVCFGVTPTHVMADLLGFGNVTRHAPALVTGHATEIRELGNDLSLLTINGAASENCGPSFVRPADVSGLIADAGGEVVVRHVYANGETIFRPARVTALTSTHITLVEDRGWTISGGDSGSAVLVDDKIVGVIQVQGAPGASAGALRWDYATELIAWELERGTAATRAATEAALGAQQGLVFLAPNSNPIDQNALASQLAQSSDDAPWMAQVIEWPVDIVVSFADGAIHSVHEIIVDGTTGNIDSHPHTVELQRTLSSEGNSDWISFDTVVLDPASVNRFQYSGGLRAARFRLRIHRTWGEGETVALDGVELLTAE